MCVRLALLCADKQLIVPAFLGVCIIYPYVSSGRLPLLDLLLPLYICRRVLLEVKVAREWESKTLVKTPLVEEVCLLEGGEVTCYLRWSGEYDTGIDVQGWFGRR